MTVRVITDTSACIPDDFAKELGIHIVPMAISEEGERQDMDREMLLAKLDEGAHLTTSAPTPGDYLDAIEEHAGEEGTLIVTLAASMSSTNQSATIAAQQVDLPVEVVDTGTAAGGVGLVAVHAARRAQDGADLETVRATAEEASSRVSLVAVIGSLKYLRRSGRVPELAGKAGDAIGLRPMFAFRDGKPNLLRPSLGDGSAHERLIERVRDSRPKDGARLHATVLHGDRPTVAEELMAQLKEMDPETSFLSTFGPAVLVHTGPELVGVAWWWQDP